VLTSIIKRLDRRLDQADARWPAALESKVIGNLQLTRSLVLFPDRYAATVDAFPSTTDTRAQASGLCVDFTIPRAPSRDRWHTPVGIAL
jgi:hypothetical protein